MLGTDDDAIVRRIVSIVFSAVIRLKYPHTAQATATSRRWHGTVLPSLSGTVGVGSDHVRGVRLGGGRGTV